MLVQAHEKGIANLISNDKISKIDEILPKYKTFSKGIAN